MKRTMWMMTASLFFSACVILWAAPGGIEQMREVSKNAPQALNEPVPEKPKAKPKETTVMVKSFAQLKADFQKIRQLQVQYTGSLSSVPSQVSMFLSTPGSSTKPNDELKMLMRYRAVVGLPFENLKLDRAFTLHAEAAAYLLNAHGSLSHNPPSPEDFSEELYQFAIEGTSNSNLYWSDSGMAGSVRCYMEDSDATNITNMGHRRWCLNPTMGKTGFGEFGKFSAMWAFDTSSPVTDYDFIAFPARGLTPVNMLEKDWAWSVSLNPKKYQLTGDEDKVSIHVTPAKFDSQKRTFIIQPNELDVQNIHISKLGFGVPFCVIFQPKEVDCTPGVAYCVEIIGFSDQRKQPVLIQYWVVFCRPLS